MREFSAFDANPALVSLGFTWRSNNLKEKMGSFWAFAFTSAVYNLLSGRQASGCRNGKWDALYCTGKDLMWFGDRDSRQPLWWPAWTFCSSFEDPNHGAPGLKWNLVMILHVSVWQTSHQFLNFFLSFHFDVVDRSSPACSRKTNRLVFVLFICHVGDCQEKKINCFMGSEGQLDRSQRLLEKDVFWKLSQKGNRNLGIYIVG